MPESKATQSHRVQGSDDDPSPGHAEADGWVDELEFAHDEDDANSEVLWRIYSTAASAIVGLGLFLVVVVALAILALARS